ncbi:unnamed protein product [Natator depressus]
MWWLPRRRPPGIISDHQVIHPLSPIPVPRKGGQIKAHLEALSEERDELEECKDMEEGRSEEYLEQIEAEKQLIVALFQHLHHFLEEQERPLLAQPAELKEEIA